MHPSSKLLHDVPDNLRPIIEALLDQIGCHDPYSVTILKETLRLISGNHATADLKIMARVIEEVSAGLDVFHPYQAYRKVAMFGSARTPRDHPHYAQTRKCARALRDEGFMIITGAGPGIMQAANEGAGYENSFGININLPMEQGSNPILAGSPRHFKCQYFFTRKLFFLKESDAIVLSPGGFGTLDEAFETITLLQTGRNPPIPVVLLEAPGDDYWGPFVGSWMRRLINDRFISPEDVHLMFHTDSVEEATKHITSFYSNYHSFRYAGKWVVLRILNSLPDSALERLNAEFSDVLQGGVIEQVSHWPHNDDPEFDHLPRLRMHLNRSRVNVLPQIIRRMNALMEHENGEMANRERP
jgi:uncharacterized protein (TIGR00730 family)